MWKRIRRNYRRLIASLLTMAMVVTNAGGNLGIVFAAGETESALFLIEGEELRGAIREAEEQGEVFDFSELHLAAKRKSIKTRYEKLLGKKEGSVYALNLEIDDSCAPEETGLQVFYNAGTKDVIFLFLNGSDMVVNYRVNIDGYETDPVWVNPNTANIEADGEEDPDYAENYEAADMIDDEAEKLGAEVLNPEETSGAAETETGTVEEESKDDASGEETNQAEDGSEEGEKGDGSAEVQGSEAAEEGNADGSGDDQAEESEKGSGIKAEAEGVEEMEAETEAVEETEPEDSEKEKSEAEDGELLSISRHEAYIVAVSAEELEDREAEAEKEAEAETGEAEKETEAETEEETGAETEPESKPDEDESEAANAENKSEKGEAEAGSEPEESEAETESKPDETETGAETGGDIVIEETGEHDRGEILDKEDTPAVEEPDSDTSGKNGQIEKDGQLLEDDSVGILGELKGKEYDTVTVLDHVNAKAWRIALEEIEAIISSEATDYVVEYQVNDPEGAAVKGADSVAEGEDLYFAVEPEEGYEIAGVYANGSEVEEVEDAPDLASASDWKGYTHIYTIKSVSEDLYIEIETEELYPEGSAKKLTEDTEDAWITVEIPDGAFEEEVDFQAEKITEDSVLEQLTSQAKEALEADQKIEGVYAYDIRFVTAADEEVEPAKPIDVSIKFKEDAVPKEVTENATEVSVVHLPDGEDAKVEMTVEQVETEELKFQAESFSVRMAMYTSRAAAEEYAEVGDFEGLKEAIDRLNKGEASNPIRLTDNITADGTTEAYVFTIEKNIKIDLNGRTLTWVNKKDAQNSSLFRVEEGGVLTITDSSEMIGYTKEYSVMLSESKGNGTTVETEENRTATAKGGTITLQNEIMIKNGENLSAIITVAGGKLVMENGIIDGAERRLARGVLVVDNGSVSMEGGAIIHCAARAYGNPYGSGIFVKDGSLAMSGGIIAENGKCNFYDIYRRGGGIGLKDGSLDISGGVITGNETGVGGGISAESGSGSIIIRDNAVIIGNSTMLYSYGGGVSAGGSGYTVTIRDGALITKNIAKTHGGGVSTSGGACLEMKGGEITGNEAHTGGGINTDNLVMTGGIVAGNIARGNTGGDTGGDGEGGGIRVGSGKAEITGGYITNNETKTTIDWGGGGLFVSQGATMIIKNLLVTGNTAQGLGGGIGGCSTGQVAISATDGVASFGNTAQGNKENGAHAPHKWQDQAALKNDDFLYYGSNDFFCAHSSYVSDAMLGGGSANWHGSQDTGTGYRGSSAEDGEIDVQQLAIPRGGAAASQYLMGLSANPSKEDRGKAMGAAKVFITGNKSSTHGGGIMCNGTMFIGAIEKEATAFSSVPVEAKKVYQNTDKTEHSLQGGDFTFALVKEEDFRIESGRPSYTKAQTAVNDEKGKVLFTISDLTKEGKYIYYLVEEPGEGTIIYDPAIYKVVVDVTDSQEISWEIDTKLTVTTYSGKVTSIIPVKIENDKLVESKPLGSADTPVFTNTYDPTIVGNLRIIKSVSGGGRAAAEQTYIFTVTGPDSYSETVRITGSGQAALEGLTPGIYHVKEEDAFIEGYDWTVTGGGNVTVPANADAQITITNTYTDPEQPTPEEPTEPEQPTDPEPTIPEPTVPTSSGGGGGGNPGGPRGGGNTPGGPGATMTIDEPVVPLADLPPEFTPESMLELIEDADVPLVALPRTGDSRHTNILMMMLGIAGLGILFTAAGLRKKKDESSD